MATLYLFLTHVFRAGLSDVAVPTTADQHTELVDQCYMHTLNRWIKPPDTTDTTHEFMGQ